MTAYNVALFIHVMALLSATAASAIVHFAAHRRAAAPMLREAMDWGRLIATTSRVFPIAVVTLILTGGYMVGAHWSWQVGWAQAGIAGAVTLLVVGAVIGKRGAGEGKRNLARLQQAGHDLPNDGAPDRVAAVLGNMNTWLALSIVLVMTVKPTLAGSLTLLAIGAAIGAMRGARRRRVPEAVSVDVKAEAA